MGTPTTILTFQPLATAQGLGSVYRANDPFLALYPVVTARNVPYGIATNSDFASYAQACLSARGLIYAKKTPGDCGQSGPLSDSDLQDLQFGSSAASATSSALASIGIVAGAATAGIGLGIGVISSVIGTIFANHAKAVQTEQTTLCQVASLFNQIMKAIDAGVADGNLSPSEGTETLQNYCAELSSNLAQIQKVCDAACFFNGFLKCHVDFSNSYYPWLAPGGSVYALSPGAAPSAALASNSPLAAPSTPTSQNNSVAPENALGVQTVPNGTFYDDTVIPNNQAVNALTKSSGSPARTINGNLITGSAPSQGMLVFLGLAAVVFVLIFVTKTVKV